MAIKTESRTALGELIDLLQELDSRWAGPDWNMNSEADVTEGHRALMHMLEGSIASMFESNPAAPDFRRIVAPWRKFSGDNGDAIYFDAPVSAEHSYLLRGNMSGSIYVSITVEIGTENGGMASKTGGVINDTQFDVDADGNFKIQVGGKKRERNWLPLEKGASRLTTRHYYEEKECAAANPARQPFLSIQRLDPGPPSRVPDDASVAAGIRRAAQFIRSRTLEMPPMADAKNLPSFVNLIPNEFPTPVKPGDLGLAAFDAAYSMAPYMLGPDEALVITGRWPKCRCANVSLWNRHQQTYDYANRNISLNRAQTQLEPDGSFRMVLAHEDPGVPNWIDTEGRPLGLVFWRFMLPEEDIETPRGEVVLQKDLAKNQ